ncbi:hypothetical protein MKW98_015450 [Papaver atlanticum]|uniref:Uncharacterized protein n=1 Tax=Papaver atlanticum TaxID=357466 RepID=A0AAD4RZ13_9MAGN|nr:hypothetical protein MKW98_015450 [Papaver atlanticum]
MSSSKRQKKTSSQAGEDGQQTINVKVANSSDREKQEQEEREARLKFEQQVVYKYRMARAEEHIRREREQREYNERVLKEQLAQEQFNARPENQFIAERTKARKVEGQCRRRLNEKEQQRGKERKGLLNIRSEASGKAIEQHEGDHINSPLDAQASTVHGGEVNLAGEPRSREQSTRQQTQSDSIILDDKEYRQRVLVEKQRQTQVKIEFVNVVPVYVTRSAAQKARRATEREKKAEM